jgi:hypothetical protein
MILSPEQFAESGEFHFHLYSIGNGCRTVPVDSLE